jgi:hypothetical protein
MKGTREKPCTRCVALATKMLIKPRPSGRERERERERENEKDELDSVFRERIARKLASCTTAVFCDSDSRVRRCLTCESIEPPPSAHYR